MAYGFRNLVFEGGGVKGLAYVGVMEVLESKGILDNITRIGGTSAGAINAILTATGYTNDEVRAVLGNLDFNNFLDDSWGIIRDLNRLRDEFGFYKGDFFRDWIGDRIEEKTGNRNLTFKGLHDLVAANPATFRDIYVCATNLSTHFTEVFSVEHTPRTRIADAIRMSMSIPLFFAAVRRMPGNDIYVDGGLLRNYPVKLFDREKYIVEQERGTFARTTDYYDKATASLRLRHPHASRYIYNKQTLGFRLDTQQEIAMFRDGAEPQRHEVKDLFDYAVHLVRTLIDSELNRHLHSDDWQRTVYVDTLGVQTTDFDLSDEMKLALVESGRRGAQAYFDWFDNPDNHAINQS